MHNTLTKLVSLLLQPLMPKKLRIEIMDFKRAVMNMNERFLMIEITNGYPHNYPRSRWNIPSTSFRLAYMSKGLNPVQNSKCLGEISDLEQ